MGSAGMQAQEGEVGYAIDRHRCISAVRLVDVKIIAILEIHLNS